MPGDKKFAVTVKKESLSRSEYHIIVSQGGHGNVLSPGFKSQARAERVAAALYKILLPEFERERKRRDKEIDKYIKDTPF